MILSYWYSNETFIYKYYSSIRINILRDQKIEGLITVKKKVILTTIVSTILITILFLTLTLTFTSGAPTTVNFTVNLSLGGNAVPVVTWVESGLSPNPTESTATTIWIKFNATDNNGHADIDYSTASVILTRAGETQRTSGSCNNYGNDSLTKLFNCSVNMEYYDEDGTWTINASVQDFSAAYDDDTATTLAYGTLQALRGSPLGITFGTLNLNDNEQATNDPLILNNTGNQNFTQINLTAFDLTGVDNPAQYIAASDLYANISLNDYGDQLSNNTMVALTNGTLYRDIGGVDINRNLYFWINVPSSGLSNQNYTASSLWQIEVFP